MLSTNILKLFHILAGSKAAKKNVPVDNPSVPDKDGWVPLAHFRLQQPTEEEQVPATIPNESVPDPLPSTSGTVPEQAPTQPTSPPAEPEPNNSTPTPPAETPLPDLPAEPKPQSEKPSDNSTPTPPVETPLPEDKGTPTPVDYTTGTIEAIVAECENLGKYI